MDGSAAMFVDAIDQAGIEELDVNRRYIRVLKPVRIESGSSWAEFRPYDGHALRGRDRLRQPGHRPSALRRRHRRRTRSAREIARARTFGFMRDVERLWGAGYALGSSLENSVVIGDDDRVINMEGLRFKDEFVRHKTLDAMGDLALAGARFIGCFRSYRGGHKLNAMALRHLLSDRTAFEIVETGAPRARPQRRDDRGECAGLRTLGALIAVWPNLGASRIGSCRCTIGQESSFTIAFHRRRNSPDRVSIDAARHKKVPLRPDSVADPGRRG